ncbi:hypothetical protein BLOT_010895 [Blomia tropicalis]|nr:hypothetical protein BLOT_010895 [Blomia tropicalis]
MLEVETNVCKLTFPSSFSLQLLMKASASASDTITTIYYLRMWLQFPKLRGINPDRKLFSIEQSSFSQNNIWQCAYGQNSYRSLGCSDEIISHWILVI